MLILACLTYWARLCNLWRGSNKEVFVRKLIEDTRFGVHVQDLKPNEMITFHEIGSGWQYGSFSADQINQARPGGTIVGEALDHDGELTGLRFKVYFNESGVAHQCESILVP